MKYQAIVSYDGTQYQGFQSQTNGISVQDTIEKAYFLMTQSHIKIFGAGRTDKGVHAKGQVFHFESNLNLDEQSWLRVNDRLPLDIRILKIKKVKEDFHARHSAKSKIYQYIIAKKPSTAFTCNYEVYIKNLDIEIIKTVINDFVGTHDFKGFCQHVVGKPTIKTIYKAELKETAKHYIFTFHGNHFLKYMVRSMMGTLIQIGLHKKSPDVIKTIIETKNRTLAGKTAEARGLYLIKIYY
jgi:tRNA pseudouridine38-40 synthase